MEEMVKEQIIFLTCMFMNILQNNRYTILFLHPIGQSYNPAVRWGM